MGTKRQAADTLVEECARSQMPYVTERWLGGTLTNFRTIRSRLEHLENLENLLGGEQALSYSKKMLATLNREQKKIERNLSGIRNMSRLPEALMVIDPHREHIAVAEARKLGIKVVALLDTDCDPDAIDLPIPGNDDSMRSIELVIKRLTEAIIEGRASAPAEPPPRDGAEAAGPGGQRGDRRGDRRAGGGPPAARGGAPAAGISRSATRTVGQGTEVLRKGPRWPSRSPPRKSPPRSHRRPSRPQFRARGARPTSRLRPSNRRAPGRPGRPRSRGRPSPADAGAGPPSLRKTR